MSINNTTRFSTMLGVSPEDGGGALQVNGSVIYVESLSNLQSIETSGLLDKQVALVAGDTFVWNEEGSSWEASGAVDLEAFGVTYGEAVDNKSVIETAISQADVLTISGDVYSSSLEFSGLTDKRIEGGGRIIGISPADQNDTLLSFSGCDNIYLQVDIDCSQDSSTEISNAKFRYGLYINDCVNFDYENSKVSAMKIGFPIYVTGTSYNGIDVESHGSKNIGFTDIVVKCIPPTTYNAQNACQVVFRSDFYTDTSGGTYIASSNGVKEADYKIDLGVTYPATTSNLRIKGLVTDYCERVSFLNVKDVTIESPTLTNSGFRGITCSPSCEDVRVTGGYIQGGNGSAINFAYACKNCSADGVEVIPHLNGWPVPGESTALRTIVGCENISFSNIRGQGGIKRAAWIIGCSEVELTDVYLSKYNDGASSGTEDGLSVVAGIGGNTSSHQTSGVRVYSSRFEADNGYVINEFTGAATYADGAISMRDVTFLCTNTAIKASFTGAPVIRDKTRALYCDFIGSSSLSNFQRRDFVFDHGNSFNSAGTATFQLSFYDTSTSPDSLEVGESYAEINGDTGAPDSQNQGVLRSFKINNSAGFRRFIFQHYYPAATTSNVDAGGFYLRYANHTSDTWGGWLFITV